ncbi:MAG TPA: BTAD domain-containing putative transcriptional regulator [Pseudonocardia sp.]|nr:BTAD domain-containing putative transcriptional regulator [Pseudonocardia sp.]
MLDLLLLGPLEALVDECPLALGPPQQRALLAALALRPGSVVGVDALVDALWAERVPESATNILQGYVARLRAVLVPRRDRGRPATVLVTRPPGYLLAVPAEQTDAGRFATLVEQARRIRENDPLTGAATFRRALALWRGDALADLADIPVAVSARTRLGELRRAALTERIDADLAAGRGADLVGELEALVGEDPLRESSHRQLMLALYRAGRPADALAAFARARRTLAEELGLDPGPELRELEAAILRHDVPPPMAAAQVATIAPTGPPRLPTALTRFVGRDDELAELRALSREHRLVTLTGAGGCGKTRLALELIGGERLAAHGLHEGRGRDLGGDLSGATGGEVYLVDLVPVTEGADVTAAVAAVAGIREVAGRPLLETLQDSLRAERALLLLDNCEHVLDSCAELVDTLLAYAPELRVLATSRQALGVAGELVWPVPGLTREAGVRLFADRAATPFELTPETSRTVARICARLDGMPLAIELAAVRTRTLSVAEIEVRLDDRFGLLAAGRRGGPARHRTLSAVIDWSYRLLTEPERRLFERLSAFTGDFGLAAAEAVGEPSGDRGTGGPVGVVDLLAELVDKSLVVRTEGIGGRSRYRLLDTLRQYARARLAERGETAQVAARHAAYYAELADRITPLAPSPTPADWGDRLVEEGPDLRTAVRWSLAEADGSDAATIMGGSWWLWWMRGPITEGQDLLEAALRAVDDPTPPTRARLLYGLVSFALARGRLEDAERFGRECHETSVAQGDDLGAGWGLAGMGLTAWARDDYAAAEALHEQAAELARRSGDRWHEALGLAGLGRIAADRGANERARRLLERSAGLARDIGQPQAVGFALGTLATLTFREGHDDEAVEIAERALLAYRESGSQEGAGSALRTVALVALRVGDIDRAAELQRERLVLYRRHGLHGPITACLEDIAEIAVSRGHHVRAARLLGAAEMLRESHGTAMAGQDRDRHRELVADLRSHLPDEEFREAWADGRVMDLDGATRLAETVTSPGPTSPGEPR